MLRRAPWLLPFALYAAAVVIAAPWGNFPVNDDWQYARTAKHFAETGHFVIDTEVAPALFGQSLLAWPLIHLFGFSHLLLRCLTLLLGLLVLWCVDALLAAGEAPPRARLIAGATLALNPLAFYLDATFMTEVYGLAPTLLAAVLWFRCRRGPAISLLVGALCALGFWTRQYSVAALPALAGAALFGGRREGRPLRAVVAELGPAVALCTALVAAWFPWTRWTGNYRPEFASPLSQMTRLSPQVWLIMGGISAVYLTASLAPLLLQLDWPRAQARLLAALSLAFIALGYAAKTLAEWTGSTPDGARSFLHSSFPYLGNIVRNAGLGPMTFPEIFRLNQPSPLRWPAGAWLAIESCILVAMVLWSPLLAAARRLTGKALEVALFGALLAFLQLALAVQAYQLELYDRYLYPAVVGGLLVAGVCVSLPAPRALRALSPLLLLLLGAFSVGAVHDEFAWMSARWRLVEEAHRQGIPPENLQAGYEPDGWFHYDRYRAGEPPRGCIGACGCALVSWYCQDDSYRIGMARLTDATAVQSVLPATWLTPPWPIGLTRRTRPRAPSEPSPRQPPMP